MKELLSLYPNLTHLTINEYQKYFNQQQIYEVAKYQIHKLSIDGCCVEKFFIYCQSKELFLPNITEFKADFSVYEPELEPEIEKCMPNIEVLDIAIWEDNFARELSKFKSLKKLKLSSPLLTENVAEYFQRSGHQLVELDLHIYASHSWAATVNNDSRVFNEA